MRVGRVQRMQRKTRRFVLLFDWKFQICRVLCTEIQLAAGCDAMGCQWWNRRQDRLRQANPRGIAILTH